MTFRSLPIALALVVAACQPAGPPPTSTSTSIAADAAQGQLAALLENRGFAVEQVPGGLTAISSSPDFAKCLPVNVSDGSGDGRRQFTQVQERRAMASVRFAPSAAGTDVSWSTRYSGRYLNRVNNSWFERVCQGTGELERLLETALPG